MLPDLTRITADLIRDLDEKINELALGEPHFSNVLRKYPFKKENFRPVLQERAIEGHTTSKLAFIDGGNGEILGAPNFSIQFNRICYCLFKGKERIQKSKDTIDRIEFLSCTYSSFRNKEIYYDTITYPLSSTFQNLLPSESDLSFDSSDRSIMDGRERADIRRVASIARRFAEWSFAAYVAQKELEKSDAIVMDGTLHAAFTHESAYEKKLYEATTEAGITVTGVAKTSRLFTDTGLSLIGAVQKFAEDCKLAFGSWYLPIAEVADMDHQAMIFVTKLNQQAKHVFRYEIQRDQHNALTLKEIDNIFFMLAENSRDITFAGYPFGCAVADSYGRVSEHDLEYYRALVMGEAGKQGNWPKFSRHIQSVDAHEILNSLVGL